MKHRILLFAAAVILSLSLLSCSMDRQGDAFSSQDSYSASSSSVDTGEDILTGEELIAYLTDKNCKLEESLQRYFSYFVWTVISILCGTGILVYLNVHESRRKDRIIYSAEQFMSRTIQVQEEERKRISQELHDSVAQDLRYVSMLAEGLEDSDVARQIIATQNANIESIRNLCYNLMPPAITGESLVSSLELLAQKIFGTGNDSVQFRIVCEDSVDFSGWDNGRLMNLYRIVQEAMQNIQKHAQAEEVTVFFKECGNHIKVIITDDGCGMDSNLVSQINSGLFESVENMHFGLRNIYERTKLIGGKITYVSDKECGTRLTVEV